MLQANVAETLAERTQHVLCFWRGSLRKEDWFLTVSRVCLPQSDKAVPYNSGITVFFSSLEMLLLL